MGNGCENAERQLRAAQQDWRDFRDNEARKDLNHAKRKVENNCWSFDLPRSRERIFIEPGGNYSFRGKRYGRRELFGHMTEEQRDDLLELMERQVDLKEEKLLLREEWQEMQREPRRQGNATGGLSVTINPETGEPWAAGAVPSPSAPPMTWCNPDNPCSKR